MVVALQSPARVGALVSVDNAPVDAVLRGDFAKYVKGMRKILNAGVTRQSEADAILTEFEEALPIRQFLLTNLTKSSEDPKKLVFRIPVPILAASIDKMGDFPFKDPQTHRYNGPAMFIRGTKSRYVADDVLPLIGEFFPGFKLWDVDCGHWVISEKPEEFRIGKSTDLRTESYNNTGQL